MKTMLLLAFLESADYTHKGTLAVLFLFSFVFLAQSNKQCASTAGHSLQGNECGIAQWNGEAGIAVLPGPG